MRAPQQLRALLWPCQRRKPQNKNANWLSPLAGEPMDMKQEEGAAATGQPTVPAADMQPEAAALGSSGS